MLATARLANVPGSYYSGLDLVQLWNISRILTAINDPVTLACRIDGGRLPARKWQQYAAGLPRLAICPRHRP